MGVRIRLHWGPQRLRSDSRRLERVSLLGNIPERDGPVRVRSYVSQGYRPATCHLRRGETLQPERRGPAPSPPPNTHTGQGRRSCGSARVMGHERGFRCRAEGSRGACWRSIRFSCDQAAARAASPRKGQAWGAAGPGPGSHATGGPSQGLINADDCGCPEIPAIRRRLCRRGGGSPSHVPPLLPDSLTGRGAPRRSLTTRTVQNSSKCDALPGGGPVAQRGHRHGCRDTPTRRGPRGSAAGREARHVRSGRPGSKPPTHTFRSILASSVIWLRSTMK